MPYHVETSDTAVLPYILHQGRLAPEASLRLLRLLETHLAEHGDYYRALRAQRLSPASDCFFLDVLLPETPGSRKARQFKFVVNDAGAECGVLRVVYVEEMPV